MLEQNMNISLQMQRNDRKRARQAKLAVEKMKSQSQKWPSKKNRL